MKIEVNKEFGFVLKEVYNGIILETSEGNRIGICMRDDTFEINIILQGISENNWWRVDMQKKAIAPL